jgi:hypothetical protein
MTVALKVLGRHSYELGITASDGANNVQKAIAAAVTGIFDPGPYTSVDGQEVSQFDGGTLDNSAALVVSALAGTGAIALDPSLEEKAFHFINSNVSVSFEMVAGDMTLEFEYLRTSTEDWPIGRTAEVNPTTAQPYIQLNLDGTATLSLGSGSYTVGFGNPSIDVMHKYAVVLRSNVLTAYVDGVADTSIVVEPSTVGWTGWSAGISSSNNNRTIQSSSNQWERAAALGKASGKWYWEVYLDVGSSLLLGIANTSFSTSSRTNMGDAYSIGLYLGNNGWYQSVSGISLVNPASGYPNSAGNRYMFALDMDNRCLYVGLNGSWFNGGNPASGAAKTGALVTNIPAGTWGPAMSMVNATVTLRTASTQQSNTAPSGYQTLASAPMNAVSTSGSLPNSTLALQLGRILQAPASSSFQPSASDPTFIFSNNNRTFYSNSGWANARAAQGKSSGKWYWELQITQGSNLMLGLALSGMATTGNFGSASNTIGLYLNGNNWFNNIGATVTQPSGAYPATVGDVYMFALDMDNRRLYVGRNGTWYNGGNPATGATPLVTNIPFNTWYPAISVAPGGVTFRSTSNECAYSVPSGYTAFAGNSTEKFSAGYMRNLRLTSKARYSANYTPASTLAYASADADWAQVKLYAAMNDSVGATTFTAYKSTSTLADVYNLDAGTFGTEQRTWELFDAAAGTNAVCYRSKTKDNTYKYVVVDLNTAGVVLTKVYESWDATTHTGTNLAASSDTASYAQKATSGQTLHVFATDRWLALHGLTATDVGSALTGCFEISRDDEAEPIGVYPRFAWLSQYGLYGYDMPTQEWGTLKGQTYNCFSLPRTIKGDTGQNARKYQMTGSIANHITATNTRMNYTCTYGGGGSYQQCGYVWHPWYGNQYQCTTYQNAYTPSVSMPAWKRLLEEMLPTGTNPWATGTDKNYVFSPYAVDTNPSSFHIRGRFYGLKLLANNVGASGDTINIKMDQDGLYSQTGNARTHFVSKLGTGGCVAIPLSL